MKCTSCGSTIPNYSQFCNKCGAAQELQPQQAPKRKRKRSPNGSGHVFKRGDTWYIRCRRAIVVDDVVDGAPSKSHKNFEEVTRGGFATSIEARKAAATIFDQPKQEKEKIYTLDYYWNLFSKTELTKYKNENTPRKYKSAYSKIPTLHHRDISALTIQDLREAIDSGHHSYDSAKEIKSVLKNLFKLAAADGRASASLPGFIILPEHEEKEVEPFNADEVKALEKLWDNGHLFAGYIILMIYTGMMPGELLGLKKPMILLDEKVIRGAGLKTKRRKKLDIVLADFLIPIIQKLMEQSNTDKFIRINEMNFYAKYYETLEMAQTKRRTPYACRHSTATALALHPDIPPAVISRILRHSAQMTEHYTHPDNTEALKAVNKLKPEEQKSAGA